MTQYGEPWTLADEQIKNVSGEPVLGYGSDEGAIDVHDPRMKRIVACVNACASISDELLADPFITVMLSGLLERMSKAMNNGRYQPDLMA